MEYTINCYTQTITSVNMYNHEKKYLVFSRSVLWEDGFRFTQNLESIPSKIFSKFNFIIPIIFNKV